MEPAPDLAGGGPTVWAEGFREAREKKEDGRSQGLAPPVQRYVCRQARCVYSIPWRATAHMALRVPETGVVPPQRPSSTNMARRATYRTIIIPILLANASKKTRPF